MYISFLTFHEPFSIGIFFFFYQKIYYTRWTRWIKEQLLSPSQVSSLIIVNFKLKIVEDIMFHEGVMHKFAKYSEYFPDRYLTL